MYFYYFQILALIRQLSHFELMIHELNSRLQRFFCFLLVKLTWERKFWVSRLNCYMSWWRSSNSTRVEVGQ